MATRVAGNYNVPYDPREWVARGSRRSSLVLEGRNVGAEAEGMCVPFEIGPGFLRSRATNVAHGSLQKGSPTLLLLILPLPLGNRLPVPALAQPFHLLTLRSLAGTRPKSTLQPVLLGSCRHLTNNRALPATLARALEARMALNISTLRHLASVI